MCPACFATAAAVLAGATSAGGLVVLAVLARRTRSSADGTGTTSEMDGDDNGSTENRLEK